MDLIAGLVHVQSSYYGCRETVRILDPCCGAGEAVSRLAGRIGGPGAITTETFGVELHAERAEQARERLDRTLAVDLFNTSIANAAFGVLLLNPPYDHDGETKRVEHRFLVHTTRYLAESGLLIFIVPRRRLAVSARYLASHYRRIRCWAFPEPERQAFDQVVLIGYRRAEPHADPHAEEQIRAWAEGEPETLSLYRYPVYTAQTTQAGDVLFATRTVDPVAAAAEARRSGLWVSPEITDSLWPAKDLRTRPLMPLRRGHMAMLIAAGLPGQPLPRGRRPQDPRQGKDKQGVRARRGHRRQGDLPRETPDHRRLPRPRGRTDHRHRSIDGPSEAAVTGLLLVDRRSPALFSARSKDSHTLI